MAANPQAEAGLLFQAQHDLNLDLSRTVFIAMTSAMLGGRCGGMRIDLGFGKTPLLEIAKKLIDGGLAAMGRENSLHLLPLSPRRKE